LYDINTAMAAGEVMDLEDEAYFTGIGIVNLKHRLSFIAGWCRCKAHCSGFGLAEM
jgi:hypothetical protein